jgi:hypothetical protein
MTLNTAAARSPGTWSAIAVASVIGLLIGAGLRELHLAPAAVVLLWLGVLAALSGTCTT